MKVAMQPGDVVRELQVLASVLDKKVTIPVLGCVLMTVDGNGTVTCAATNLEAAMRTRWNATAVYKPGTVAIPAERLLALAQTFPLGDMTLAFDERKKQVTLESGRTVVQTPTLPAEDFPGIVGEEAPTHCIPAGLLLDAITRVKYAVRAPSKETYAGAHFEVTDKSWRLVGFDGHELAVVTYAQESVGAPPIEFTVPERSLLMLAKWLAVEHANTTVSLSATRDRAWFISPDRSFMCRLVDQPYPAYLRILQQNTAQVVSVDADAMLAILRRHTVLALVGENEIRLDVEGREMRLSTKTTNGQANDVLEVEKFQGEPLTLFINPAYVINTLGALASERVLISVQSPKYPVLWTSDDPPLAAEADGDAPKKVLPQMVAVVAPMEGKNTKKQEAAA